MKKNFTTYFDKIYCLNYIHAKLRRDFFEHQLKILDLADGVEYIYGMPVRDIKIYNNAFETIAKTSKFGNVANVGATFSHYTAIKMAFELGYSTVMIFEDDVTMLKDRDTIIKYLDNIPADADFLYFTPCSPIIPPYVDDIEICLKSKNLYINLREFKRGSFYHEEFLDDNAWSSSCAYAMNRKAMACWLLYFENANRHIVCDSINHFYHNISQSPLNCYTTNIALFSESRELDNVSITENGEYQYKNVGLYPLHTNITSDNFFKPKEDLGTYNYTSNK